MKKYDIMHVSMEGDRTTLAWLGKSMLAHPVMDVSVCA